jgi:uncharacterized protein (UPF0548 family)
VTSLDSLELTYSAVGASANSSVASSPPDGYRGLERTARTGTGAAHFSTAAEAVLAWGVQRNSGFGIRGSQVVAEGSSVTLLIPFGPFRVPAAARVVYVVQEPRTVGFAYGTLPGHPENGEEAFIVEHRDDDSVWIVIRAFSRPANPLWWLVSPVLRLAQEFYTRRYLRSLA